MNRILDHYSEDFEMTTPMIVLVMNDQTGTLKGKKNVKPYWEKALERVFDLRFELIDVFVSVNSLVIYYKAVLGKRAAEILFFGKDGKVHRSIAHYNEI
ncbi:nuclear transport factor 2 family protein [Methanosarcina barkeri]|uniref:nuclear transport factor 2 family protein n=1 Tax=Methanosarcina barkeri TaxID=2208 RepID=UPI0021014D44|nr:MULTISPECIES: nuclear transport factor 2 family protein [Methanosarcina]